MDTGSSDFWVLPPPNTKIQLTNTTNINVTNGYGIGEASGTIQFAEMVFGGFKVPYQGKFCINSGYLPALD